MKLDNVYRDKNMKIDMPARKGKIKGMGRVKGKAECLVPYW